MQSIRERIIQCAARISDLRAELSREEMHLDLLLQQQIQEERGERARFPVGDELSIAQRVVGVLDQQPGKDFSAEEIARHLKLANVTSLRATLARLVKYGKVLKAITRGRYKSAAPLRAGEQAAEVLDEAYMDEESWAEAGSEDSSVNEAADARGEEAGPPIEEEQLSLTGSVTGSKTLM